MHGLKRKLEAKILELLEFFPAVALLGPRQCGKTTLAHEIQAHWLSDTVYLDLERQSDLAKLDDCISYLGPLEKKLVVIDEVQNRPALFPEIRGLIDEGRRKGIRNGRFLFLGSASHELLRQSGESLAGRIAYLELTPFLFGEVESDQLDQLWIRGGFPDSFLAPAENLSLEWRRNFVETYLSRDLNLLGKGESLPALRSLLQMTAHLHGQVLNVSQLVASHEFTRAHVNLFLDLFEQTFVLRRLPPYYANMGKRLIKRPKIYLRDSGILHQLLNVQDLDTLHGHPMRGTSWEGFVIEQAIALLPEWSPFFYRTSNGAELDLLLLRGDTLLAFEIKASAAPKLTKGFHTARQDVKPEKTFVVTRSGETWSASDDVTHTCLGDLPEILEPYA